MLHIALHFIFPAIIVAIFFRKNWQKAYVIMVATMLVDLDHLFATPIYDPARCSVGFHLLHKVWFIPVYIAFCFFPRSRLVGIGLSLHMALDSVDCQVTNGIWAQTP